MNLRPSFAVPVPGHTGRGNWPARVGCWLALAALFHLDLKAESLPPQTAVARSVSGQFVVINSQPAAAAPALASDQRLLKLEPALLTVMCERVKQALTDELGFANGWRGKVYLTLHPAQSAEDGIGILAERFKDGWVYRLNLPNPVERVRLIRALVQVVLLEQTNRGAAGRTTEIPLWLSEGLLQQVLETRGVEVILPPPELNVRQLRMNPILLDSRRTNVVTLARLALGEAGPLSWEKLSWPMDNQLAGPEARRYQLSALLLVAELLRFEDGPACLRQMLAELPNYLNWQLAFLRGFKPHFETLLDVEKWWSLQAEFVTGRDEFGLWTREESWIRLDEVLRVAVQVRQDKRDLPKTREVSIADVMRDWDLGRQTLALRGKLAELHGLRSRIAAELLPIVDRYRRVLSDYLELRNNAAATFTGRGPEITKARLVLRDTLKELEALEGQRSQLKPAPEAAAPITPPVAAKRAK